MARTPQEIFQHHVAAIGAGDVDAVVADYAEDAVLVTPQGVTRGREGIRQVFTSLLGDLPDAAWEVPTQVFEGDVLLIEWTAVADPQLRVRGIEGPRGAQAPGMPTLGRGNTNAPTIMIDERAGALNNGRKLDPPLTGTD